MKRKIRIATAIFAVSACVMFVCDVTKMTGIAIAAPMKTVYTPSTPFVDDVTSYPLDERWDCTDDTHDTGSDHPVYCLNSGGQVNINSDEEGRFSTLLGDLPNGDYWHELYETNNPGDTASGAHPQNLFRFFIRQRIGGNVRASAFFRIDNDNFDTSANRNSSNGILLLQRAHASGGDDTYYGGVRVDGLCIIKKKVLSGGTTTYTTLTNDSIPGPDTLTGADTDNMVDEDNIGNYNSASTSGGGVFEADSALANLLTRGVWSNIQFQATTISSGTQVKLEVFVDEGWQNPVAPRLVCSAVDTSPTSQLLDSSGQIGIRTDFMDVTFDKIRIEQAYCSTSEGSTCP